MYWPKGMDAKCICLHYRHRRIMSSNKRKAVYLEAILSPLQCLYLGGWHQQPNLGYKIRKYVKTHRWKIFQLRGRSQWFWNPCSHWTTCDKKTLVTTAASVWSFRHGTHQRCFCWTLGNVSWRRTPVGILCSCSCSRQCTAVDFACCQQRCPGRHCHLRSPTVAGLQLNLGDIIPIFLCHHFS